MPGGTVTVSTPSARRPGHDKVESAADDRTKLRGRDGMVRQALGTLSKCCLSLVQKWSGCRVRWSPCLTRHAQPTKQHQIHESVNGMKHVALASRLGPSELSRLGFICEMRVRRYNLRMECHEQTTRVHHDKKNRPRVDHRFVPLGAWLNYLPCEISQDFVSPPHLRTSKHLPERPARGKPQDGSVLRE